MIRSILFQISLWNDLSFNCCTTLLHPPALRMPLAMEPRPSLEHHESILRMHRRQRAPPGVTPNYVNPETTSDQVTITGLTLIVFSALFVVARLSVKLRVVKKQSWDDCESRSKSGLA
ncbi:MAG: hypothetical protein Q9192_005644 [Flavoplaca navasiana]